MVGQNCHSAASSDSLCAARETKLGMDAKKDGDFSSWYSQVLTKSEMLEYYDVSGCYILRPWCFFIWKSIQEFLGKRFEELGVQDAYFPLFVSQGALCREKDHVEGFAPEVAWVTKSGQSELAEPIAIRPTSETIMYPAFAKWVQSHRDLPLRVNQWCNVVRWEFKHPQPFIRTREFLWQEGHTAFNTKEEADAEVLQILELYARTFEDLLAVPFIKGRKTEKEKFAGALYTTTLESFVPTVGRGIQSCTSHCLGQNFSRMFRIAVEDERGEKREKRYAWQNSWGLSTRTIGIMTMVHGDDQGLVLPPRVASVQVIVVPCGITASTQAEEEQSLHAAINSVVSELRSAGIRAQADLRETYTPGWKFNYWELKGVPVRIELGPRDLKANEVRLVRRFDGAKRQVPMARIELTIKDELDEIHSRMLARAVADRDAHLRTLTEWADFTPALDAKCMVLAPFCMETSCEDAIRADSKSQAPDSTSDSVAPDERAPSMGAKSLCVPFAQPRLAPGQRCIHCDRDARVFCLFGRSY